MFIALVLVGGSDYALAQDSGNLRYEKQTTLAPNDYMLKSRDDHRDPVFDRYQTINLGVNLGIGSDCGRVDFKSTLRSSLSNMLDSRYFGDLGKNILAASPMLATCYFSPTWCAILKHSQLSANFLSQMRLDQCALIDKTTDSRVEDFYQERQTCVHEKIRQNGGNLETAMDSCRNVWQADLSNWAGGENKVESNKLVESSAAWAGYKGEAAKNSIDLLKAFVGDTVVTRGQVSVDYGTRGAALTPQRHLQMVQATVYSKLCRDMVSRVLGGRGQQSLDRTISDRDLKDISGGAEENLVDRQTIEALSYMPAIQREQACRRLSDVIAMTTVTKDLNRSLDILAVSTQNPHLPPHRKAELEEKRRALKESTELTLELQRQRNEPLNRVVSQINGDGAGYRGEISERALSSEAAAHNQESARTVLLDCADAVMCQGR
jgi:hypothetical protein